MLPELSVPEQVVPQWARRLPRAKLKPKPLTVPWQGRRRQDEIEKTIAFFQIVFMVFLNVWNVRIVMADDSDIFGNNIEPNVMILLDSSGNMEDSVGTLIAYAPATSYSALVYRGITINATTVYNRKRVDASGL